MVPRNNRFGGWNLAFQFRDHQTVTSHSYSLQKKKKKKQIYSFCVVKGRNRRKNPVIFRVRNKLIKSIDQYPMTAIISSPAATATTRTAIFKYDVQFGRFCNNNNNNNKGCCFLSVHSFSPPKLSPKQPHRVKLVFVTKAADSSQASPSSTTTASKTIVTDDEFSLAKVLIFLLLLLFFSFCLVLIYVELISFIKFVVKI